MSADHELPGFWHTMSPDEQLAWTTAHPPASYEPVMAKDVMISKLWQACCYRRDCTLGIGGGRWVSETTDLRAEADKARRDHLDAHRAQLAAQEGANDGQLV